ncbi:type II secretion system GspH family protein [Marinobacter nauticus]
MNPQRGFTLVELVMVIILLGIVATISVQFVALSTQGAIDVGDRQQRALQGVVISDQITREIRGAFPLSVRTNGSCLEWLPILGGSRYRSLPTGTGGTTVDIFPFGKVIQAGARLIVYGYGSSQNSLYEPGVGTSVPDPGPVSPAVERIEPTDDQVTFAGGESHRFRERSPEKRIYAVGDRISICQGPNSKWLYRYSNYQHGTDQPTASELAAKSSRTREVMSANLVSGSFNWQVAPISLQRSAVVYFEFELFTPDSDETTLVSQEVQIRNVP